MATLEQTHLKGFEIHERIGAGGFGEVYRARQTSIGRDVAIKVVLPALANEPDFIRRFEIEAQLVANLEHPHITPLYDYWRDPDGAFLVMRFYPRGSLHDALERDGAFAPEEASRLVDQIASALDLAHRNGIVHRDVKPSNVLLDADGNAYLSDFGIAKSSSPKTDGLTREGAMVGSPDYLAPEQARGEAVAAQSDIYSLGVLLHELLSGRHPFHDSDPVQRLARHLHDPLPPLDDVAPDLRTAADTVIARATAKDPKLRYESATAFALAFREAIGMRTGPSSDDEREAVSETAPSTETAVFDEGTTANPFVGLRPFRSADAAHFHGRERLVTELLEHLGGPDGRLLALVGPSGSGKSSVLHAGVLPALRSGAIEGSERWFVSSMVPGGRPLDELEVALTRIAVHAAPSLREHLGRDANGLVRSAQIVLPDDDSELVLAIDQFEELFTVTEDEPTRRHFLALLHAAITDPRSRIRIVLTLRADFFDRPLQRAPFADELRTRVKTIVPMNDEELRRAITRPARAAGLTFDDGLVGRMIDEVRNQPGALPLLQFALTRLYEERENDRLTRAAYDRIGGVGGALAKRADDVYEAADVREQAAIRQLALRLVALGEGTEDTRRRARITELRSLAHDAGTIDAVVERLTSERLLTTDREPSTREPTVELAHEALLREWARLGTWIDASRDDVRTRRQLSEAAQAWDQGDRDASYLLRGRRLERFEAWRNETDLALSVVESEFLEESQRKRDEERSAEEERQARSEALRRRARRVMNALVVVLLVATVVSGGLGMWANRQRLNAEDQRALAEAERQAAQEERRRAETAEEAAERRSAVLLAAQAETQAEAGHGDRAVLLALEAMNVAPRDPETERALANAVSQTHALGRISAHDLGVTAVSWNPDGTRLASASQDNVVVVANAADGTIELELEHPTGISRNVFDYTLATAWSLEGDVIYTLAGDRFTTGAQDYNLFRWDAATGERLSRVEIPNGTDPENGRGVAQSMVRFYSGDGLDVGSVSGRVASLGGNNTALVWGPDVREPIWTLRGHTDDVNAVAFSPGERFLATASQDGTARIWDLDTGLEAAALTGHEGWVRAVAWGPDGERVVTAGNDGDIRVWHVETGDVLLTISSPTGTVDTLAWSPGDDRLVVAVGELELRAYDSNDGHEIDIYGGHEKVPTHVSFSPDGSMVASASMDPSVRIWSTDPINQVVGFSYAQTAYVGWSPDGSHVVVPNSPIGQDLAGMRLSIWDVDTPRLVTEHSDTELHTVYIQGAFVPGRDRLIVASIASFPDDWLGGAPVRVLDATTDTTLRSVHPTDGGAPRTIDVSPDGTEFVTGSNRQAVDVWEVATGAAVWTAEHESEAFVTDVSWSPDGHWIASTGDADGLRIWDATTGEQRNYIGQGDETLMWSVSWAPDSRRLIRTFGGGEGFQGTSSGAEIITLDGEPLVSLEGHVGDVNYGAWNPAGTRVATIGTDNTVRIWDANAGTELARFDTHVDFNSSLAWSPRGDLLFIGAHGQPRARVIRIWNDRQELLDYARDCCVFRDLTDAERQQFGLATPQ